MEVPFSVGLGMLAWVCCFVQLNGGDRQVFSVLRGRLRLARELNKLLWALSKTAPVGRLLTLDSWRHASDSLAQRLQGKSILLVREQACALILLVAMLLMLMLHSVVATLVIATTLGVGIPAWHASCLRRDGQDLLREMPNVFRTLAMALGSGETLSQAIGYAGTHAGGVAGAAFSRASLRLSCGASVSEAIDRLCEELDAPGVGLLCTALVISQRTGSPLKGLLEHSARLIERQSEFERMLAVKTAQVRLSVRVVSAIPALLVVGLSALSVDFRNGIMTPAGTFSLVVATILDVLAMAIIKRQMGGILE